MSKIDASDRAVVRTLQQAIASHIPKWYGADAVLISAAPSVRVHPYSFIVNFPVGTPGGTAELLVKIKRKPALPTLRDAIAAGGLREEARSEYEMIQLIWEAFQQEASPRCTAIKPLGFFDPWNAICMQKVEGEMLKHYLLNPLTLLRCPGHLARLMSYLAYSAEWLRVFHDRVANIQMLPFLQTDAGALVSEAVENLSRASNGQVATAPLLDSLMRMLRGFGDEPVPFALLHDDFQYSNILITAEGRVCALDYALNYWGAAYSDLATLLIDPQTRRAQILSGGRFISREFIAACRKSILDVYFKGQPFNECMLNFYCALAIINKWRADEAEMAAGWRRNLLPFETRLFRSYYSELLSQYINQNA